MFEHLSRVALAPIVMHSVTYWTGLKTRTPATQMAKQKTETAKRYGTNALAAIVRELADRRFKDTNGSFALRGLGGKLDLGYIDVLLLSIIDFRPDVSQVDRRGIVSRAIFEVIKQDTITPDALVNAIDTAEKEFRHKRKQPYFLVTRMSVDAQHLPIRRMKWNDSQIYFDSPIPDVLSHGPLSRVLTNLSLDKPPFFWTNIRVQVFGRSPAEAGRVALDDLNTLRAIWNLRRNSHKHHLCSAPVDTPINELRIGPVHTIHSQTGSDVGGIFWFERPFVSTDYPGKPVRLNEAESTEYRRFAEFVRKRLSKLKYRHEFESLLRAYGAALDGTDFESSFVSLWTVLEKLTSCGESGTAKYDDLVHRASFVWADHQLAQVALEHMRDVRNNLVHHLTPNEDMFNCVQELLKFVHVMLLFHIGSAGKFTSIAEMGQVLKLTTDEKALRKQIQQMKEALRFRAT